MQIAIKVPISLLDWDRNVWNWKRCLKWKVWNDTAFLPVRLAATSSVKLWKATLLSLRGHMSNVNSNSKLKCSEGQISLQWGDQGKWQAAISWTGPAAPHGSCQKINHQVRNKLLLNFFTSTSAVRSMSHNYSSSGHFMNLDPRCSDHWSVCGMSYESFQSHMTFNMSHMA